MAVTVSEDNASVSANSTADIADAPLPADTLFSFWSTTAHIQETMEELFKAPLTAFQLNSLVIALLDVEVTANNQLISSGMDPGQAFSLVQFFGQEFFDMYAGIVAANGTPSDAAVNELMTGLLVLSTGP